MKRNLPFSQIHFNLKSFQNTYCKYADGAARSGISGYILIQRSVGENWNNSIAFKRNIRLALRNQNPYSMQQLTTWPFKCSAITKKNQLQKPLFIFQSQTLLLKYNLYRIYTQIWKTQIKMRLSLIFLAKKVKRKVE